MRRLLLALLLALALAPAAEARAQTVVTSPGPDHVAVTVYRNPGRAPGEAMELDWLNGYALISETRRITIPAGESEIRFEGVAGGMVPQSAAITGFPDPIVERNRDAYLLSPATLLDRSLGRRVTIRRTSRATGAVTEEEAVIRSGADGAVVLQTPAGIEALRCDGLPEELIYDTIPAGLSPRPTFSVRVRARAAVTATVTLSYLASGFDWQANYVATLSADGARLDLFAWLTLASNDETSFVDADTQAVAGRLNREAVEEQPREGGPLQLRCWPMATTSDLPDERQSFGRGRGRGPVLTSPMPMTTVIDSAEMIVVTGSRMARREELGDLKLYRLPDPVTVAADSQKQVALLEQPAVQIRTVYRRRIGAGTSDPEPARRYLVTRNREADGLGLPLPGGRIVVFAGDPARPILIGEGSLDDYAVGEDVEIALGEAPGVTTEITESESGKNWDDYELVVTNDRAVPVTFEGEFTLDEDERFRPRAHLGSRDGRPLWTVTIPANGTARLRYRITERD